MPPPSLTGRQHRPSRLPARSTLLGALAVLTLLLSTAIATLTVGAPDSAPAPDSTPDGSAAFGSAPTTAARTTAAPTSSPPPAPASPTPSAIDDPETDQLAALENEVTTLTNAERAAAGCDEVHADERLRTAARAHSQDMADNSYFDHTDLDGGSFVDRVQAAGYPPGLAAGENIAKGHPTPADVVSGWMDSDGHRRNMLNCSHRAIGVGLAYDARGTPYWTQVFGRA